jgi:signal peptidase I
MEGKKSSRKGFIIFLFVVLLVAIFFNRNFTTIVVKGPSMQPTFYTGRRLLVSHAYWLVGEIRDNDIVVVSDPNPDGYIIKRVYKMGGEKVDWHNAPRSHNLAMGDYVVPPGQYFLLGDNPPKSDDSRDFGPVDQARVLGKVLIFR